MNDDDLFLRNWNGTRADLGATQVLHELFDATALLAPSDTAIESVEGRLTYEALRRSSLRVAARLSALGIKLGDRVVIYAQRSPQLVAAMLGASRCGVVFIPCDRANPQARVQEICRETDAACLITDTFVENVDTLALPLSSLEDAEALWDHENQKVSPASLCYGIYTSGSTGRPKVSLTAHAGLCNVLLSSRNFLEMGPDDRILCKASLSFDVVLWELFEPLICGGTLILAPPFAEKDPWLLAETIERLRPTTVQFVPSFMKLFLEHAPLNRVKGLRNIILAGEAVLPDLRHNIHSAFPQTNVWVLYGPSEASIYVTAWQSEPSCTEIGAPLGRPIDNIQVYLLDTEGGVAAPGETGEICLAGVGLCEGYLNRMDENTRSFINVRLLGQDLRLYRTGDFGRLRTDGVLEFAGRMDAQVKVRGSRVELGEVEACIERHPAVAIAAVLAENEGTRLVAFVECRSGMFADGALLRAHLVERLPSYMVPSEFHFLKSIPRTIAGKIDRARLRKSIEEKPAYES